MITSANAEEGWLYGLRPGGRYRFVVRAFRGDLHADSDSVAVTMPGPGTPTPGTLQGARFGVSFSALANDSTTVGEPAGWSSDKGVLYWLFDSGNPEALVKVLDGRGINGHWWFDLAVASDLRAITRVTHRGTGDEWVVITGLRRDVFGDPGATADRLVHCAYPASRADNRCAFRGYGTTISLRHAWDSSGPIPSRYFKASSASVNGNKAEAGSPPTRLSSANGGDEGAIATGELPSADSSDVTAEVADDQFAQRCCAGPLLSPGAGPEFGSAGGIGGPLPAFGGASVASSLAVRAIRGDLYGDSDSVAPTVPGTAAAAASTLQGSRFSIDFSASANDSTTLGTSGWSSDQGVLYWLFDSQNPEALVKVLDGRGIDGHWWFDLAVASDLRSVARVAHRGTGDGWVAITGFGRDVFSDPGDAADRLVHCAYPANRADNRCAVWGYGTTISLRDAWDSSGRIPSVHYD